MKEELLVRLSNADAVASKEGEVRAILKEELSAYSDEITYDTLGSISFHKKGTAEKPLKIMFCAHMDEVGFLVRHISDIGFVYLIALGGVTEEHGNAGGKDYHGLWSEGVRYSEHYDR